MSALYTKWVWGAGQGLRIDGKHAPILHAWARMEEAQGNYNKARELFNLVGVCVSLSRCLCVSVSLCLYVCV